MQVYMKLERMPLKEEMKLLQKLLKMKETRVRQLLVNPKDWDTLDQILAQVLLNRFMTLDSRFMIHSVIQRTRKKGNGPEGGNYFFPVEVGITELSHYYRGKFTHPSWGVDFLSFSFFFEHCTSPNYHPLSRRQCTWSIRLSVGLSSHSEYQCRRSNVSGMTSQKDGQTDGQTDATKCIAFLLL